MPNPNAKVSLAVSLDDDQHKLLYKYQLRLQKRFDIRVTQQEVMRFALKFAAANDNA
jgi:hypothetical protein